MRKKIACWSRTDAVPSADVRVRDATVAVRAATILAQARPFSAVASLAEARPFSVVASLAEARPFSVRETPKGLLRAVSAMRLEECGIASYDSAPQPPVLSLRKHLLTQTLFEN